MKKKFSKTEAKKQIDEFFKEIKDKSSKEVGKIKRLAMRHNIKLGIKKRQYCSKCFHPYKEPKIRIGKGFVNTACEFCGHTARWKLHMDDLEETVMPINKNSEVGCC